LKHEVSRKALCIALDLLNEGSGLDAGHPTRMANVWDAFVYEIGLTGRYLNQVKALAEHLD
jgi:hypothetical protein